MQKRLVHAVTVAILERQYSNRKQTVCIYGTSGKTHQVNNIDNQLEQH
jgi:chromosomal replication initiation ATPase DnaA